MDLTSRLSCETEEGRGGSSDRRHLHSGVSQEELELRRDLWATQRHDGSVYMRKKPAHTARWLGLELAELDERLLNFRLVAEAHRQEVAPGAPPAWSLVEVARPDLVSHEFCLGEVAGELLGRPRG